MAKPAFDKVQNADSETDVRIRLQAHGETITSHITPFAKMDMPISLSLSRYALEARFQDTRYKTTARDFYEGERARLKALTGSDEVIFLNSDTALCEGSFTSLFIEKNNKLLTPALSCGLLAGVLRQALINRGDAEESLLTMEDVKTAEVVFVGNSLRGLMPAKFLDFLPH